MEGFEEYKDSDGVAAREFKTLRNEIRQNNIIINEQSKKIKKLEFLVIHGRHELLKKKLITIDEIKVFLENQVNN
jgi:hypothetical protein